MVSTRSGGAAPKQAKLEEFDAGAVTKKTPGKKSTTTKAKSEPETSKSTTKANSKTSKTNGQNEAISSRKRKAHQPPTPPPKESIPSDNPEEEGRPRKVPKGSVPSDPIGAAKRAAETRRKDPRGGAPEARKAGGRDLAGQGKPDIDEDRTKGSKAVGQQQQQQLSPTPTKTAKRKTMEDRKTAKDGEPNVESVMINRSPVLTLWAACVTAFLHPKIDWTGCLSAGAAIATLCAVSKGRAIGKIEPKDDNDDEKPAKKEEKKRKAESADMIHVMHFPLHFNANKTAVTVSGKPKNQSEDNLVAKFGGIEAFQTVKRAMEESLESSWQGQKKKDALDEKAFGMYEKFRPNVPSGGGGWGRKGELKIERIREVVGG